MGVLTVSVVFLGMLVMSSGQKGETTNFSAARCCGLGPKCSLKDAARSKVCKPGRWMTAQPDECQVAACRYCKLNAARQRLEACLRPAIQKQCFGRSWPFTTPPSLTKRSNHTGGPKMAGSCHAPGVIVIPASRFPLPNGWVRTPNKAGITWKPNAKRGIDPPGSGAFCMNFIPNLSGRQYFTVLSSAPHPTEHNDAWFRFPGGVILSRYHRVFSRPGSAWLKGYQNLGGRKVANYIVHKDRDGHQFIMTSKKKGKKASVCIAGRSSKYTIYKLVIVTCPPGSESNVSKCSRYSPYISGKMKNLPPCNWRDVQEWVL